MSVPTTSDPHDLAAAFRTALRRLETAVHHPLFERHHIMAALDLLKALEPRLDAIATAAGTDIATAVANAVAPLNQQISDLQAAADQTESDTTAEAGVLGGKVATIETALGITPPAPPAEEPAS